MKSTDKAVEVSAPGTLRVVERSVPEPGVGQVRKSAATPCVARRAET